MALEYIRHFDEMAETNFIRKNLKYRANKKLIIH